MKATRVSTWRFELDNEAKKAIRFCMGYNTDLRVSLSAIYGNCSVAESTIWHFIDDNLGNILGLDFMMSRPKATDPDWRHYERCLNDIAQQVMN